MAKVNLTLPNLELDKLSDSQVIRKIASYLYIQNEQLRYELTHIDEDNMSSDNKTTVQGMTQAQVQKAIEEATKNTQNIDLSSNTIIVNLQRRLDNLGKLQSQDANNINRITQELGQKVSTTTYNAGLGGLKQLIEGNTALIGGLNTNISQLATAYNSHKHQISINSSTGVISIGGPTASVTNPNISATAYFKNAVAEAYVNGEPKDVSLGEKIQGSRYYINVIRKDDTSRLLELDLSSVINEATNNGYVNGEPKDVSLGAKIQGSRYYINVIRKDDTSRLLEINLSSLINEATNNGYVNGEPTDVTLGSKIQGSRYYVNVIRKDGTSRLLEIDLSSVISGEYNAGWNDCIDACNGDYYLDDYSDYNSGSSITLYRRSTNAYGDVSYSSAGYHIWRYGGSRVYRYTIPAKK